MSTAIASACLMSNTSAFLNRPTLMGVSSYGTSTPLEAAGRGIAVSDILKDPQFPEVYPFKPDDFRRDDETVDTNFYSTPRLVTHIDDQAIAALTKHYQSVFFPGASVLDICSSWVSHFPKDVKLGRTAGVGMNDFELSKNPQLTEYVAKDLNVDPRLPYPDNTFDFTTIVVSVDYLTRPLEVFAEMSRVLKPGGMAIISQSNRCFPTKGDSQTVTPTPLCPSSSYLPPLTVRDHQGNNEISPTSTSLSTILLTTIHQPPCHSPTYIPSHYLQHGNSG